ncbi:hypothetical protein E4L98_02425 [Duganella callida]|uniref:Uncharacterized protein n=2 Tax=Duganella callida TaxID=2561932 RepID=A0A4Y9SUA1_9BURK|nr:hypothetical protein E4L98_02425 [Duganella callida]
MSSTPLIMMLGLLLACLMLGSVFLVCLRRLRRDYASHVRLLSERERVATGLHDTLLQSMQGMILRFQGVSDRLPHDSAERATIEHILDQADEVLAEGRHQILALRIPVVYGDNLAQALAAVGQSLRENFHARFSMLVTGDVAQVNGDRGEEIYSITREALYNAFRHAQADHVELELVYGCEFLTVYVRDNGRGMAQPPRSFAALRERAAILGGTLDLMSLPERGTEVILRASGRICYQVPRPLGWQHRLAAWLSRTEQRS